MIIIVGLLGIIVLLIIWIYSSGGGTMKTKKLNDRIEELERKNKNLKETNEALRSNLGSNKEGYSKSLSKIGKLAEELVKVKEALRGCKEAEEEIEKEYGEELGPSLVKEILSSEKGIGRHMKRDLAHRVLVGKIGKSILKELKKNKGLNDASANAGIPLRIGKEEAKILKETGYLDNRLNLTEWGREALRTD